MSVSVPRSSAVATPEAPWLGLRPFTEDAQEYFFGREEELDELSDRILGRPLTILFGTSGLGKSSLLQAALMPRLRAEGFLPVHVRFDHDPTAPSLEAQLLDRLAHALAEGDFPVQAQAASATRDGTMDPTAALWLLFHDPLQGFAAPIEGVQPRPVVLIDQFEEIFTLGEQPKRREINATLRESLATLIENRPPAALRAQLEADDELADRVDYRAQPLRVLLSLREDFLHILERWRRSMPSLMENRLELRMLSGPQALEAVVQPGQRREGQLAIIPDEVGRAIVRFVAGVGEDVPLEEIDAVPPLLSLVCAELNAQRIAAGDAQITRTRFEVERDDILRSFYERSFDPASYGGLLGDQSDGKSTLSSLRNLIEAKLLSSDGFRENIAFDTIQRDLSQIIGSETSRIVLDAIVERRLLTVEERGGVRRLELAHDVLTRIVKASRDERQEKEIVAIAQREKERAEEESRRIRLERNRLRILALVAVVFAVVAVIGAIAGWIGFRNATRAQQQAERRFDSALLGLSTINDNYVLGALENIAGLSVDQDDALKAAMRSELLGQLVKLHEENPGHRKTNNLIARIRLEECRYAVAKKDYKLANSILDGVIPLTEAAANQADASSQEMEIYADSLLERARSYSNSTKNVEAEKTAKESLDKVKLLTRRAATSWRLEYVMARLENVLILATDDSSEKYLAAAERFRKLAERSGGAFEPCLWYFILTSNALWQPLGNGTASPEDIEKIVQFYERSIVGNNSLSYYQQISAAKLFGELTARYAAGLLAKGTESVTNARVPLEHLNAIISKLEKIAPSDRTIAAMDKAMEEVRIELATDPNKLAMLIHDRERRRAQARLLGENDALADVFRQCIVQYTSAGADDSTKAEAVEDARAFASKEFLQFDLDSVATLFNDTTISESIRELRKKKGDHFLQVYNGMVQRYVDLFAGASSGKKNSALELFSDCVEPFLQTKFDDGKYAEIASFWKDVYSGVDYSADGNNNPLIVEYSLYTQSLLKLNRTDEARRAAQAIMDFRNRILKVKPWDYYAREAALGMNFDMAVLYTERGDKKEAQDLLRDAYRMLKEYYGADVDLSLYPTLPLRGKVSESDKAAAFFNNPTKKFVIPCDVNGKKVPVQFFFPHGTNAYQVAEHQFRWVKEYRGVNAPEDVHDSLRKLNEIATENKVDFTDLCTYALNYSKDDDKGDGSANADKLPDVPNLDEAKRDVEARRKSLASDGSDKNKFALASALGNAAFASIFQKQFEDAINWSNEASRLTASADPKYDAKERASLDFVYGNLAHALLFTGKFDEALKIYQKYWDKSLGRSSFKDAVIEDFARFDKAGLNHPDLPRMKKALGIPPTSK